MSDYTQDPQYQQAVAKAMTYNPEQRAILTTAAADEKWASEDERGFVNSILRGSNKDYRERSLALRETQFDTSMGLQREQIDADKKDARWAVPIAGLSAGVGALQGYREIQHGRKMDATLARTMSLLEQFKGGSKPPGTRYLSALGGR